MKAQYARGPMIGKLVTVMAEYAVATGRIVIGDCTVPALPETVNVIKYASSLALPVDRGTAWGICDEWISFLYENDQVNCPHIDVSGITREWATETLDRIFN